LEGDYPLVADGLYVDYYLAQKNYDKAFEYGDKLFALDPDNFQNALNMIRAARKKATRIGWFRMEKRRKES